MRVLSALVLLLLWSCPLTDSPRLPPGPEDPVKNLAQLDAFADRVQVEAMTAAWRAATEPGSDVKPRSFGILPLLLLTDDEVSALNGRLHDVRQLRCLQAIHAIAVRMQSESDGRVAETLARISALREQMPDLRSVYTDEGDVPRRRELWLSQAPVARSLAPLMRQLIAARNHWAWQRSRSGYPALMKQHRGYEPRTADVLEAQVRKALGSREIPKSFPWEFELIDPALAKRMARRFDQAHCLERASFVFRYLGLPAAPPGLEVRMADRNAFSSFASYPIHPPTDQRITVRPGAGIVPHWSAFHEFGHAAMSLLAVPTSWRTLRRPVSPAVSESCAKIAERLFYSEEWLQLQDVPQGEIEALRGWEKRSERMRMRSILADLELERALYRNPTGDLMTQYIAIQDKTAGVVIGRDFPAWALKRDIAYEPLGRVDYLLARCAQAAVYRRLRQLPGGLLGEPARQMLRNQVFRGASELRFEEWFRKATGSEPDCSAWLQDVVAQDETSTVAAAQGG
ncbi:MAG TPA: hypothetical protein VGR02_21525 [Thermoanaerobaculia bacterium]|nr:hypothetical protein [Thermoanaerobaculia bacterium]